MQGNDDQIHSGRAGRSSGKHRVRDILVFEDRAGHVNIGRNIMKEDLIRIIDRLGEEDLYLLYVTALEMLRK